MLRTEFESRTGFYTTAANYAVIEKEYSRFDGGKDEFCQAFKENRDGLAEKIQRQADEEHGMQLRRLQAEIETAEARIAHLKAELEREQEWKPYEGTHNVPQKNYDRLKLECEKPMTDDEAKDWMCQEFGFERDKIKIIRKISVYEINRHGRLRKTGEIDREPYYAATDWNYIRFNAAGRTYECYNDELQLFWD